MTYYINPIWFYLSDICYSTKGVMLGMAITLVCFGLIGYLITSGIATEWEFHLNSEDEKKQEKWFKRFKVSIILGIIAMFLFCIIPSKEGVTKMMIASVVTQENVQSIKGDAKELIDYITEKAIEIEVNKDKNKED